MFKRIAIGAVSLALPLAALGAAPASAASRGHDGPEIDIQRVAFQDGYFKVKVDYDCEPDHAEAKIRIKLSQDRVTYRGSEEVDCDDDEATIKLYKDGRGRLKNGHAHVRAVIVDKHGDRDRDDADVRLRVKWHH